MIAAGVVWHSKTAALPRLRASSVRVSTRVRNWAKLVLSPYLIPRRRLPADGSRANFAYVPVRVYYKVCFNLLKDENVLQFVRRADDFVKFVRK